MRPKILIPLLWILLYVTFLLVSCSRTDDSMVNNCISDCTTVSGRITTDNSIGISGVEVEFYFKESPLYGSFIRILGRAKTNKNGEFQIKAFIKDEELGYMLKMEVLRYVF